MRRHLNALSNDSYTNLRNNKTLLKNIYRQPLVLIGGGGHALSLMEAMPDCLRPEGYTALGANSKMSLPWLGDDQTFRDTYGPEYAFMTCAFVYNGRPDLTIRRRIIDGFNGYRFAILKASSATVTSSSSLGEGTQVLHRAVINRASLGQHCIVNTGAVVEHDCRIGANVFIGPGAVIGGEVTLGDDVFIGLGACVRNGVEICSGAIVGMGAVVTSDIKRPGIYVAHGKHLLRL